MDGDLTSASLGLATAIAMMLNQMLTNLLPSCLIALLLSLAGQEGLVVIKWSIAIWLIYSIGSIASLALLQSQSRS